MSQVVATEKYCLESSVHLTRPGIETFFRNDGVNDPTVIDKHQVKRLYRLQRAPYVNTRLHLDTSEVDYEKPGYFESILQKQVSGSMIAPTAKVYRRPSDMSDRAMARFSFGKSRLDPQRMVPSETTSRRNHPAAITSLRHEQGAGHEIVPRFTDRLVPDRSVRARIGPGGSFNSNEDGHQGRAYLRSRRRFPSQTDLSNTDELARQYMYTSVQQAASDEVAWDSKLSSKVPVPLTTYEADGSDPFLMSRSLPSFYDSRSYDVLEWDRLQPRDGHFIRKPFNNVAPLPRAQQISGYSGVIGGEHIQDIDNPTIDFKPYTLVRTEQPKAPVHSFKSNMPSYTGKTHWDKIDPISHHNYSGHALTTTGVVHKSLPFDNASPRHIGLHGSLSRAVTTVYPQNPFNYIEDSSRNCHQPINTRPRGVSQQAPARSRPSPAKEEAAETTTDQKN